MIASAQALILDRALNDISKPQEQSNSEVHDTVEDCPGKTLSLTWHVGCHEDVGDGEGDVDANVSQYHAGKDKCPIIGSIGYERQEHVRSNPAE